MVTTDSNDITNAEFASKIMCSKYVHDKMKLIVNGKAQLQNLINSTKSTDIKIGLIVVMGKKLALF
jgi:hypothetical protein